MNGRRFSLTPPPLPPPNALPPPPLRPPPKRIALQLGNQLQKTFQAKYSKVMDQEQTPSSAAASELANHAVIFRVLIILVVLFILVAIVFGVLLLRLFIPHHSAGQQQQQQCTILSVEEGRGNGSSSCSCNSSSSSSSDPSNFMDTVYSLEKKILQQISTTTSTTDPSTFEEEEEEEEVATTLSGEELLKEEFGEFLNIVQAIRKPSRPKKPQKNFEPEGGSEEESNATTSTNTTESSSTSTTTSASISPSSPPPPPSIILNMTTNSVTTTTTTTTTTPESQTYTTINFEDFGNDSNSSLHSSNSTVRKLAFIRDLLRTEWANYRAHAWGEDSLTPVSLRPVRDVFGNHTGAYLVGGLSSLWVMGLREQFQEAVGWVNRTDLEANFAAIRHTGGVHVYQTVANYLGGLLSAHVLSGEAVLLERARQLAELLEGAYVKKTGLPRRSFIPDRWFRHAPSGAIRPTYLPHITAAQLEYSSLYSLTGESAYQGRLQAVTRLLAGLRRPYAGLYLDYVNPESGQWAERAEILGGSRPLYAHLIKRYIQSGGADHRSLELFKRALRALERNRVFAVDPPTGQLLVNCLEDYEEVAVDVMLVEGCQLGATLGLGARELEREFEKTRETLTSAQRRKAQYRIYRLWELAEQITDTCYKQSLRSKSGLPASRFYFTEGGGASLGDLVNITKPADFEYTLGPELAESYFTLWRLTHERKYRDYAWQAVQAIATNARHPLTGSAATALDVVGPQARLPPVLSDEQQPVHYIAATLKFLYLTFAEDDLLPLDEYVFTGFGQPLPVEKAKESEKRR